MADVDAIPGREAVAQSVRAVGDLRARPEQFVTVGLA
jgi:hypothetical protein